jgi:flagellar M-ring protein FliF
MESGMEAGMKQAITQKARTAAEHLRDLPINSRLLIGAMLVILLLVLVLVAQFTGSADMAPLPVQIAGDGRAQTISFLETAGIPFTEQGEQILVPAEQKYSILARLTQHEVIGGSQIDFATIMSEDSPFRSKYQSAQRYRITKMQVLGRVIAQMDGIDFAEVVIDEPDRPAGLGASYLRPSASVMVKARQGEIAQKQVDAIAHLVAGSHSGLKAQDVKVIDAGAGRVMRVRADADQSANLHIDIKAQHERDTKAKLLEALSYIPGVLVEVTAIVDTRVEQQRIDSYDEPKVAPVEESSRLMNSSSGGGSGEAGVRPNAGASVLGSSRKSTQTSDEHNQSRTMSVFPKTNRSVSDPKGYALKINASIGVPRSYFVSRYRQDVNDVAAEPDAQAIQTLVDLESSRIRTRIEPLIDTIADPDAISGAARGTVVVDMIPDFTLASAQEAGSGGGPASSGAAMSLVGAMNDNMVKTVSLGALAIVSLAMMFVMVRKASNRTALPTAAELVGVPPALQVQDADLVGEADESAAPLEGVEVDDNALRRQQILEQINQMVKAEPAEAAGLLRRWLRTEL